jgi:hypothetical protein
LGRNFKAPVLAVPDTGELVILCAAPDFENAKKGAQMLFEKFEHSPDLESISLYFDSEVMAEFSRYLYDYRFVIAGKETLALLETGREIRSHSDSFIVPDYPSFFWRSGSKQFYPNSYLWPDRFSRTGRGFYFRYDFTRQSFLIYYACFCRNLAITSSYSASWVDLT